MSLQWNPVTDEWVTGTLGWIIGTIKHSWSVHISFTSGAGGHDDHHVGNHWRVCIYTDTHGQESHTPLKTAPCDLFTIKFYSTVCCHDAAAPILQCVLVLLIPSAAAHRNKKNWKHAAAVWGQSAFPERLLLWLEFRRTETGMVWCQRRMFLVLLTGPLPVSADCGSATLPLLHDKSTL